MYSVQIESVCRDSCGAPGRISAVGGAVDAHQPIKLPSRQPTLQAKVAVCLPSLMIGRMNGSAAYSVRPQRPSVRRRRTQEVLGLIPATVSSGAQASRCGAHVGLLRDEPLAIHALELELDDDVRSRAVPGHEEETEVLNAVGVESWRSSGSASRRARTLGLLVEDGVAEVEGRAGTELVVPKIDAGDLEG